MPFPSLVWLALGSLLAAAGCRTRPSPETPAGAVGFELPGGGVVARGALVTEPRGREEVFVPFVAGGAPGWVAVCSGAAEGGSGPAPRFSFDTDGRGTPRPSEPAPEASARDRCLGGQAGMARASGLPADTRVIVQLALRGL